MNEEIERIVNKIKKGAELTKIGEKEIKFPSGNKFVIFDDDDCKMMQDYINGLNQENARLKDKNKKAIDKLEYYNSGEALWYVPIQEIIDILKEN